MLKLLVSQTMVATVWFTRLKVAYAATGETKPGPPQPAGAGSTHFLPLKRLMHWIQWGAEKQKVELPEDLALLTAQFAEITVETDLGKYLDVLFADNSFTSSRTFAEVSDHHLFLIQGLTGAESFLSKFRTTPPTSGKKWKFRTDAECSVEKGKRDYVCKRLYDDPLGVVNGALSLIEKAPETRQELLCKLDVLSQTLILSMPKEEAFPQHAWYAIAAWLQGMKGGPSMPRPRDAVFPKRTNLSLREMRRQWEIRLTAMTGTIVGNGNGQP